MNLSPAQTAVTLSDSPRILVTASPGSGKTRTLVETIRTRLARGIDPARIIAVTFTNKGADEVRERLDVPLGHVGTLHSLMLRLLRQWGGTLGFKTPLTVLNDEQAETFLQDHLRDAGYKKAITPVRELLVDGPATAFASRHPRPHELIVRGYYNALKANGVIDYDSILAFGAALINGQAAHEWLSTFDSLFVDEFQDTSDIDNQIYEMMPIPRKYMTGDQGQACFGFRGGNVRHILNRESDPVWEKHWLTTNYRSDIRICEAGNQLLKQMGCSYTITPASSVDGHVKLMDPFKGVMQEMAWVAERIQLDPNPGDCAVLLRTNALVDKFTEFLSAYGLPVAHLARPRYPSDWSLCRLLIQLLSQPDNDYLAFEWLNITRGISAARVARSASLEHRTTINRSYLKLPPFSPAALLTVANEYTISSESQSLALDLLSRTDAENLDLELSRLPEFQPVGSGVNVLTMHAGKGKEWSTVILPSFEQCFIPGRRKDMDVESERRLAFVAVTRAKHTLLLSHCTERKLEWMPEPIDSQPSQFIAEMGL